MNLHIRYLASLGESLQCQGEQFALSGDSCSLADLRELLAAERGDLLLHSHVLCARNGVLCPPKERVELEDGDEVAFFPPMTGG